MTALGPEMRELARQASALLAWMCVELQRCSRQLGVEHVLFMTREGLLFKPYYERFWQGEQVAKAELLNVSRLATFAASLHRHGAQGLERLFNQYPQAGWRELLASLGELDGPPAVAAAGAALGRAIAGDPRLSAWLEQIAAGKHQALAEYLQTRHAGALQAGRLLVVDIGWRGTIQDNLALAFPQLQWHGVYLGLHAFMNAQPPNAHKLGLLFDPSNGSAVEGDNLMPIEYLFHQAVGTVAGYRQGVPQTLAADERGDGFSEAFQAAVLDDAPLRFAQWSSRPGEATVAEWQREALEFWSGCQRMPPELFGALCRYSHEETFGLGRVVNMAAAMSPRAALRGLVSRRERALFVQYVGSLPLAWRHERSLGLWLRGWLYVRHVWGWLRSGKRA